MTVEQVDTTNIQGSIWPRLPKFFESFLFFHITDTKEAEFKNDLKSIADQITTGAQCKAHLDNIKELKEAQARPEVPEDQRIPFGAINVSFSYRGIHKLVKNEDDNLRGGLYKKGMYSDLVFEGADDPARLLPEFKPPADNPPNNESWRPDGVFLVAAESQKTLHERIAKLEKTFRVRDFKNASLRIIVAKHGQRRPGEHRGKEHFGFEDHISQPQIEGLDPPPIKKDVKKGEPGEPSAVPPGYIFVGHKGDPMAQPSWAKGGSFLVFRQLDQKVPEFEKFVEKQAKNIRAYQTENGAEKLAAHMMGRWKSGAPVELTPDQDDEKLAFVNNFDWDDKDTHKKCPFAAHVRKMRPRADLKEDEDDEDDPSVILRRGITFGPEVGEDEKEEKETKKQRGIYFACYQSDIRDGFNLIMTRWASNHYFPEGKRITKGEGPGVDPFVSQRLRLDHPEGHISLYDGEHEDKTHKLDLGISSWVDQRGGEYFFTPPISALTGRLVE